MQFRAWKFVTMMHTQKNSTRADLSGLNIDGGVAALTMLQCFEVFVVAVLGKVAFSCLALPNTCLWDNNDGQDDCFQFRPCLLILLRVARLFSQVSLCQAQEFVAMV